MCENTKYTILTRHVVGIDLYGLVFYTLLWTVLSGSGVTRGCRKGMDRYGLISSVMNWIWGSMEVICSRNWVLCSIFWLTKVLSTYLLHSLGVRDVLTALISKSSMNRIATFGLKGDLMAFSVNLVHITYPRTIN